MKRITWLVGPPGSGKSTFAKYGDHGFARVAEFNRMLFPLLRETQINSGVLSANHKLVELVRGIELHADNLQEKPILVVAGLAESRVLFPLSESEEVWLLLPEREQWKRQFSCRPSAKGTDQDYSESYKDLSYSALWYAKFEEWLELGLPLKRIDLILDETLIGKRHYD